MWVGIFSLSTPLIFKDNRLKALGRGCEASSSKPLCVSLLEYKCNFSSRGQVESILQPGSPGVHTKGRSRRG
jgi:hypothetical protein